MNLTDTEIAWAVGGLLASIPLMVVWFIWCVLRDDRGQWLK